MQENPPFATSIHIKFGEGQVDKLDAAQICAYFEDFGDFYLTKDTPDSVFMEFAFIDPAKVADQKMDTLIDVIRETCSLQIEQLNMHQAA